MKTVQYRAAFVLLTIGLGVSPAWSVQPGTSAAEKRSSTSGDEAARTEQISGAAQSELPNIMSDDDIPAFLRTDPCDSGDA